LLTIGRVGGDLILLATGVFFLLSGIFGLIGTFSSILLKNRKILVIILTNGFLLPSTFFFVIGAILLFYIGYLGLGILISQISEILHNLP